MTKLIEEHDIDDELLEELADFTHPIVEKFEQSEDHALFTLGVKLIDGHDGEEEGVKTYINATGYYGILSEGLISELYDQMKDGNMTLFAIFRDVVRDLEDEFGIDRDEEIQTDDTPQQYH